MTVTPEVSDLLARLAELAVRNTAGAVFTRVQAVRARRQDESTVNELVDIINELIDEKTQLIGIARALESQVVAERISDDDLNFLAQELVPTVEKLIDLADDATAPEQALIDAIKQLLSKETLTILQLIGFNFKAAIGQPLTVIVERLITSRVPADDVAGSINLANARREVLALEIAQDPEAFARLQSLYGNR